MTAGDNDEVKLLWFASVMARPVPQSFPRWRLCGWIERMPGGFRQNDGLETGIMEAAGLAWL